MTKTTKEIKEGLLDNIETILKLSDIDVRFLLRMKWDIEELARRAEGK